MLLPLAILCTPVGIWSAGRAAALKGKKDPGFVVIDEVLGQWITLAALPVWSWQGALAAFLLFRIFDMTKPWPLRRLEDLPSGTGIVADDLGAGIYGAVLLRVLIWVVLPLAGWFNLK
jgi:phosphatidylglycerophosphatase A